MIDSIINVDYLQPHKFSFFYAQINVSFNRTQILKQNNLQQMFWLLNLNSFSSSVGRNVVFHIKALIRATIGSFFFWVKCHPKFLIARCAATCFVGPTAQNLRCAFQCHSMIKKTAKSLHVSWNHRIIGLTVLI